MPVPKKLLVNDIINFDFNEKTYTGHVSDVVTIAEAPNGPFVRYAVIKAVFNDKIKTVKIKLARATMLKYGVELRYRHGQEEDFSIANNAVTV